MSASPVDRPIIIAHRGASGERPEHTLASYERAIDQGADFVEPDLVMTWDGVLVARHENEISGTTDVADHPEFADRKTSKVIDGEEMTGWFTEDFTLAELRTLRAKERLPQLRPANTAFDGLYAIPTMAEIIALVRAKERETGRTIGIYPETKHPGYFQSISLPMELALVELLAENGYMGKGAPIFIQSFEVANLRDLAALTELPLIQLMANVGGPADVPDMTYAQMAMAEGLAAIAAYADGVGVEKSMVIPRDAEGNLGSPTPLVEDAHKAGLKVHIWTLRRENFFLPKSLQSSADPRDAGDLAGELRAFVEAGVDGVFSDNTAEVIGVLR